VREGLRIVLYEPGAEHMAGVVAAAMPAAVETVERRQYGRFIVPVRVYVCATVDSFAKYTASPRAGGHTMGGRVFLSPKPENTDERIPRLLAHELSHLHLGQRLSLILSGRLPVWFEEGLAVEVSGGGGAEGVTTGRCAERSRRGARSFPRRRGTSSTARGRTLTGSTRTCSMRRPAASLAPCARSTRGDSERSSARSRGASRSGRRSRLRMGVSVDGVWRRFVGVAGEGKF
jgi:hypothetical protein